MLNALSEISSAQLQRAVVIKERIEALERDLSEILGNTSSSAPAPAIRTAKSRGTISAAGRARIIAAQKARWARQRRSGTTTTAAKPKRKVSAAARAKMAAVAKARWAK